MKTTSFPKDQIKILLLENIHPIANELLQKDGFNVELAKGAWSEEELLAKAKDAHVLGIRSKTQLTKNYLQAAERLMTVGCFCIGTNQVDLKTAKSMGSVVFNAPFSNTRSVAELIMAEIVMLARNLGDRNSLLHEGKWQKSAAGCFEVRGKTIGIVGYGHIGSQVSVLAESFGMKVIYYDIVNKMPMGNSQPRDTLDQVLTESDFLTLHVPQTESTRNMIGAEQIKKMKRGSFLLNASRGTVVKIPDLEGALKEKHLAGAAIDVFPEEPQTNDDIFKSDLQKMPNVILTPHIGGSTEEAQENIGREVAGTIIKYINNGNTSGSVNFPQVDVPHQRDNHRVLNIHKNVPGVLREINRIVSDAGANIQGQYLATDPEIGYLIMDLDKSVAEKIKMSINDLPESIRTRILY